MKKIKNIQKEKLIYSKPKYIILIILNIILLFFLTVILLTCMTFRYYIKSSEIPKALGKIILEEIKIEQDDGSKKSIAEYMLEEFSHDDRVSQEEIQEILEDGTFSDYIILAVEQYNHYLADGGELPELDTNNLKYPIKLLNKKLESVMYKYMYKSKTGFFLRIAVSIWIEIILAILMLLLLAWLIIIHKKANKKISIGLKIYNITAGFPCVIMFLFGLVMAWIFKFMHLPSELGIALRGKTVFISGMGMLICLGIFIFSIFWSFMENKLESKLQIPVQEELPETEILNRKFCRYCGEKLVNDNAQFCYQCGKTQ